jgi:hypothetical protein
MTRSEFRLPLRYRVYVVLTRLSRRVGLRGGALLSLGTMSLTYGYTLTVGGRDAISAQLPWPDASIRVIGYSFYAVGVLCLFSSFAASPSRDRPAFAVITGFCTAWGLAFLVLGDERPVARGVVFLALAALSSICARIPEAPLITDKAFPTLPPDALYPEHDSAEDPDTSPNHHQDPVP